jgi:hypothetical protein
LAKKNRRDNSPQAQFKTLLSEVNFPATRDELIEFARRKRFDDELIDMLESIPDLTYQPNQLERVINSRR